LRPGSPDLEEENENDKERKSENERATKSNDSQESDRDQSFEEIDLYRAKTEPLESESSEPDPAKPSSPSPNRHVGWGMVEDILRKLSERNAEVPKVSLEGLDDSELEELTLDNLISSLDKLCS